MIAAAILAAVMTAQAGAALPPGEVPPEIGPFTYSTLSLEEAAAQFRAICLDPLLDPEAIGQAVSASRLGYARDASAAADERAWTSRYGDIYFRSNSAMADGRPMQDCTVRFVIPRRLPQRELADRLGRLLAPGRRRVDVQLESIWDLGGSYADRIEMAGWAPDDDRFVSLNRRHIYPGPERQEVPR